MIPLHYRLKRNSVNSQTFNELAIYCCNICKRTCVCVCVEMCKISESRKRFQISTNISNEYLLCYSRLAQDRLRSKGSKDLKRGKDRSFSFDVFFPISHIYAESPRKSDFPFDFRGSTWTTRVHRTSVSTRNVYVFGVCVCILLRGTEAFEANDADQRINIKQ